MNVRDVLPRDAIPSVDDPAFRETYGGDPDDEVIAVTVDREARAYPVRYLHHHEIVNDTFGADGDGTPVVVTWCPLCGSAVVYDRTVEGRTLTFGVSGKLADDDLVMYDRETDSEWKQSLGRAVAGPLAGTALTVRPATVTTWAAFREAHPDGRVLAPPGGESETASETDDPAPVDYDDEPYRAYVEDDGFGLGAHRGSGGRSWDRADDLDPKEVVLGLTAAAVDADTAWRVDADEAGPAALAFPRSRVEAAGGVANATVGRTPVVVFATPDGIHAYASRGFEFVPTGEGYFAADGLPWHGATGEAPDGRRLRRLPARRLFAFAWQDDHGSDAFWAPEG
jgi:hypothetical protein